MVLGSNIPCDKWKASTCLLCRYPIGITLIKVITRSIIGQQRIDRHLRKG
ncbi:MAG: hypothetical protein NTY91_08560 [Euryarchaeota archaeon]|nr:hypothetical protein [Euryarchaeota archaeon]